MERYYFNVTTVKCEKFIYGGCQGNENNFESESDCQDACGEPLEKNDTRRETVKTMDFESGLGDFQHFLGGYCGVYSLYNTWV
jgi:hypothetical protein